MRAPQKSESPAATGQTQNENTNAASISTAVKTGKQARKDYATLQAQFALLGRVLNRVHRAQSGKITVFYIVGHHGATRHLNTLFDVAALLVEIGGRRAEIDGVIQGQGDHGAIVAGRAVHADHAQ